MVVTIGLNMKFSKKTKNTTLFMTVSATTPGLSLAINPRQLTTLFIVVTRLKAI